MAGFNFAHKKDIDAVLRMVRSPVHRELLPHHDTQPQERITAGYIYLTPSEGIPARVGNVCGTALCNPKYIESETNELKDLPDNDDSLKQDTVWNFEQSRIAGDIEIACVRIYDKVVAIPSGGSGGNEIMFTIDDVYGVQEAASDHCDDQLRDAKSSYVATCIKKPCSMGTVPGEDENGKIVVHDEVGFLEDREEADVIGKVGLATYMVECHGYQTECKYIITWIDWFRTIQVITGVRMSDTELCFDRKNVQVWDDCDLDPICIPLTDCVEY